MKQRYEYTKRFPNGCIFYCNPINGSCESFCDHDRRAGFQHSCDNSHAFAHSGTDAYAYADANACANAYPCASGGGNPYANSDTDGYADAYAASAAYEQL